jgi:plastocyanin
LRLARLALAVLTGSMLAISGQQAVSSQTQATQIRITDAGFDPPTLTINAGESVHWTSEA